MKRSASQIVTVSRELDNSLGRTASFCAESLTSVQAVRIPYDLMQTMSINHIEWAHCTISQVFAFAGYQEWRHRELLTTTAAERYEHFLTTRGDVEPLLTKREIASLLGITPEAFSRLLKRRAEEN